MSGSEKDWPTYQPQEIEPKWQKSWEESGLYLTHDVSDKPKYYCLDFFPYPSGEGLHVGHCRNYVPTDVLSRYKRMDGYNVLHPMGWDAFGEPAENFAVTHGVHPRMTTDRNTAIYRRQMQMIGTSYDWSREIDSSKPEFYRWTQYFFTLMYERGLAYRDSNWQWWCPECKTTLSSQEVEGGVCWRGHAGVTKKEIPAWYFRITDYADELLDSLDDIDWPERIKLMQRNWIGRSEGCEILFHTEAGDPVPVFTTRPDTVYGVTFFVLAPEHELVMRLTTSEYSDRVSAYINAASSKSEIDRLSEVTEKSGVFTGGYVINPLSEERVPVWVGDYVLPGYGSGAVMGVPAHDQRDFQFAEKYGLPVKVVISPPGYGEEPFHEAYLDQGVMVNSGPFNGLPSDEGNRKVCEHLSELGKGGEGVNYRMHDWLISRQRYWGTPIPIVYCVNCGEVPVPEDQLPVLLPPMDDFQPDESGRSPLARLPEFVNTSCPECEGPAQRETDTMGGFACSSWYFLRFTSPHYNEGPFEPGAMRYWMPVDLYVGGAEHAVLHLLYSRFWTMFLADYGIVPFREPYAKLLNQGQLLAPDGQRMSKSRGNVITPDDMVDEYGADALRVYILFMAPFAQDIQWSAQGIHGSRRFLNRLWRLYRDTYESSRIEYGEDPELVRHLHKTIRKVSDRIDGMRFNTMVSALMEFVNLLVERHNTGSWRTAAYHKALDTLLILLAPLIPHMTEELWSITGHKGSVHEQVWPVWDEALTHDDVIQIAIQVNGKLREVIEVSDGAYQAEVQEAALQQASVQKYIEGENISNIYYVPGKVLNIVTK